MNKKNTSEESFTPSSYTNGDAANIAKDFTEAVRALAHTKDLLEKEITSRRSELDNLRKEKVVLEADMGEAREASEIAMVAKAAEDEKQDALKKNQELRSYLDSAAATIKDLNMQAAAEANEVKRLGKRIAQAESEKISLVKERDELEAKIRRMNDVITEQDLKIKNLALQLESSQDDKKSLENDLASTKSALNEIQDSMASIKAKMRKSYLDEPLQKI